MSLLATQTTNTANTAPAWEEEDAAAAPVAAATPAASAAANTAPAVRAPLAGGVALGGMGAGVTLEALFKNKIPVEYNTLAVLIPNQGNWMLRETKKPLGDSIDLQLLSYQDSYVVSPEDDKAPKEAVRYSDDGVTCSDGTPVAEHLAFLKAHGYPKAKIRERAVVVAALLKAGKACDEVGGLVQLDLPPSSRTMWKRYEAGAAFGLMTAADPAAKAAELAKITATTSIATNGSNTYTLATFKTTPAA